MTHQRQRNPRATKAAAAGFQDAGRQLQEHAGLPSLVGCAAPCLQGDVGFESFGWPPPGVLQEHSSMNAWTSSVKLATSLWAFLAPATGIQLHLKLV
mmetsp:Transcript_11979/g.28046  ORF Transcript_11979/g.28046 Transcript_11979/m.28046 type:complete len:97 (+) Transcript_11979:1-291(+)